MFELLEKVGMLTRKPLPSKWHAYEEKAIVELNLLPEFVQHVPSNPIKAFSQFLERTQNLSSTITSSAMVLIPSGEGDRESLDE